MGILDDYLLSRREERNNIDSYFRRDNRGGGRVGLFTEKGFTAVLPDNRASTAGAATALLRTTGSLPSGFFNRNSGPIAFDNAGGKQYQRARTAGIGPGSSLNSLFEALYGNDENAGRIGGTRGNPSEGTNDRLRNIFRRLLDQGSQGSSGQPRQPFGSSTAANGSTPSVGVNNRGFNQTTGSFFDGYRPRVFDARINDQSYFAQDLSESLVGDDSGGVGQGYL